MCVTIHRNAGGWIGNIRTAKYNPVPTGNGDRMALRGAGRPGLYYIRR